ncbi:MAG: hypothetical protein ACLFPF_09430 [Halanaerobiales bacterium]
MKKSKLISANLTNQSNLNSLHKTSLSQFIYVVALGFEYLDNELLPDSEYKEDIIPVSIRVNKSGELAVSGINNINDDDISVYTDKRVTGSRDNE